MHALSKWWSTGPSIAQLLVVGPVISVRLRFDDSTILLPPCVCWTGCVSLDIGVEENVTPSPSDSAGPSLLYNEDQKHPGLAGFVGFGLWDWKRQAFDMEGCSWKQGMKILWWIKLRLHVQNRWQGRIHGVFSFQLDLTWLTAWLNVLFHHSHFCMLFIGFCCLGWIHKLVFRWQASTWNCEL